MRKRSMGSNPIFSAMKIGRSLASFFRGWKMKMGFEWGENLLGKFPSRVNSGHPLFIGEGRTGENPIFSANKKGCREHPFFDGKKKKWDLI